MGGAAVLIRVGRDTVPAAQMQGKPLCHETADLRRWTQVAVVRRYLGAPRPSRFPWTRSFLEPYAPARVRRKPR